MYFKFMLNAIFLVGMLLASHQAAAAGVQFTSVTCKPENNGNTCVNRVRANGTWWCPSSPNARMKRDDHPAMLVRPNGSQSYIYHSGTYSWSTVQPTSTWAHTSSAEAKFVGTVDVEFEAGCSVPPYSIDSEGLAYNGFDDGRISGATTVSCTSLPLTPASEYPMGTNDTCYRYWGKWVNGVCVCPGGTCSAFPPYRSCD
ncbi:MAG: hypothetical protein NTV34_00390 [Proteobacteria bacterium]|nr:hypothetical protein [Pseudomonadota bacterium]